MATEALGAAFFDVAAFDAAERLMQQAHDGVERASWDVEKRLQAVLEGDGAPPTLADVGALYSFASGVELREGEFGVLAKRLSREVGETDSRRLDAAEYGAGRAPRGT